jgi:hypothetical protein
MAEEREPPTAEPAGYDEPQPRLRTAPMNWMAQLHRVFEIDLSRCPNCGIDLQVIAAITDPGVMHRI